MAATCFVQPLDLVKNRMQLTGEGGRASKKTSLQVIQGVIKNEGFFALYSGLSAGLLRQASYTTVRMGVYNSAIDRMAIDGKTTFIVQLAAGSTAGAVGAFCGTPAEVSLIRMTSDGRLPPEKRRNYTSVFNALARIVREEGFRALWTGCIPTMGRSVVVNACQLSSYSQAKQRLLASGYFKDNILLHFSASMISGLITTAASMPVDIAKTRIQSMKVSTDGKPQYTGTFDVLVKVIRKEGFFSLWKGFTPYYARLGPHTVLTFVFIEQLNLLYKEYIL
ncbi:Mitochondrial 2-oxoglutarate/malate carrier protein [Fragariocoptes setiger]|uniref:Mitochondrial 2-oxoglutarate/malate carrier protein n=1 Tax=Fragariocoptes setiger TaxID=1670756 RepID=A0ABQ7S4T5_9ACAR|nr:Mitochondrial 2-oxoglutarate/malate carrier protein [Fragariocoptes setiger]